MAAPVEIDVFLEGEEAQAEAAKTSVSIEKMGIASKSASDVMNQSFGQVKERLAANKTEMGQLDVQIAKAKAQYAQLDNEISKTVALLGEEAAETRELIKDAALLNGELKELTTQKAVLSAESALLKNRLNETGGAAEMSASQMIRTGAAVDKLAGVGVSGARSISLLAGAFTTAAGPQLLLVLGVSLLIGELLKLLHHTQTKIELDEKAAAADIVAANAARYRADASVTAAKVTQDLNSLLVDYGNKFGLAAAKEAEEAKATQEYALSKQNLSQLYKNLQSDSDTYRAQAAAEIDRLESLRQKTATLTGERQKADDEVNKSIESIIQFGIETGKSNSELIAAARAAGVHEVSIARLTDALDAGRRAALEFERALMKIKLPDVDASATDAGRGKFRDLLNERIKGQMANQFSQKDIILQDAAALDELIRKTEASVKADIVANHIKVTREQLLQRERAALAADASEAGRAALAQFDSDHVVEKGHHARAGAARALAKAENDLVKQVKEAQAALITDNFGARDAKINADIAAEEKSYLLARKRKELTAAEDAQFNALSVARHEKVLQDKFYAEQRFQDELRQIQIRGIVDAVERERAQIQFQIEKKAESLIKEFGLSKETTDKILTYRRASEDEFARWWINRNLQMAQEMARVAQQHDQKIDAERAREAEIAFQRQLKEVEQYEAQIHALMEKFSHAKGTTGVLDVRELEATNDRLKALGVTIQTIEGRFGGSSRTLQQLNDRIKIFELLQKGHPFQAMALEAKQLADAMRSSQTDAERWSSFLTSAVNQMGSNIEQGFEGLVNGTTTFAQLMKKIIFDLIASMAEQWGAYYLALGIADIFWNPAKGAAELAAGAALMALAGVLHALGGSGGGKAAGASQSTQSAAGGGSGASASTSSVANSGRAPTVVSFPTSGRNGPSVVNVHLDAPETRRWWDDQMERKGMVSIDTARRRHNKPLKEALGVS